MMQATIVSPAKRGLVATVLASMVFAGGCQREVPVPQVRPAEAAEPSWTEQLRAVRRGEASEIRITGTVTARQWNELAEGCERLTVIDIERLEAPDSALSLLTKLPALRRLRLASPVSDKGLLRIAAAASLVVLNLPEGRFTDDGLAGLTALPRLELLRFHSPHVTDAGMQHIPRMQALRFLHLVDVPITDAGLTPLWTLDRLESFYLDGGRCTDDGLSRLLKELPGLHFHYNDLHLPDDPHAHPH